MVCRSSFYLFGLQGVHSIGLVWWMLAREVLRLRGTISRDVPWEVMVDLFFYRDPAEDDKEEQAAVTEASKVQEETWGDKMENVMPTGDVPEVNISKNICILYI